jgi:two-component system cell cycle sensor histidine kinase/response regulator CckA
VASGFVPVFFYAPPSLMMSDIGSIGRIALYALALGVVYAIYHFRARSALMSSIMSGIAEGIISTDGQGTIRYINPAAEELTGWRRSDAKGKPAAEILRLLDEKTHESVEDLVMKAIRENKPAGLRDYVLLAPKDGAEVPVEVTASPMRDHRGKLLGAVAVFQDVSRHRQMLDQASHSQKMEAVGRLAGGVAGDFNNLLTIITGYSELLRTELSVGNPLRRFADEIQLASERAAGLTRQLLSFSRGQVAQPRLLDVNTILTNMDTMLRRLLGERIELVFLPGPGLGRVKCDPGQIEQIIVNLAMNSRDAMGAGGKFVIETANVDIEEGDSTRRTGVEPGSYVMIAVSDTGSGMDNETRLRLFEPFFTTKAQGKGTGLGLSIVYGIVKQNQGQITVYSQVDCGTIFEIYLPRTKEMVETVHRVKPARLRAGTETILLVDDEDGVRKLCSAVLQSNGYTVIEAADGAAGLIAYEKNAGRIDLLLTDVVMPHLNGFELAERLSEKDARLGVLYMSGYRDNPVGPPGKRSERTFLHKPFTPDVLLLKVRESLDTRSSGAPGEVRGEQPPAA